jgi:hypothetical protein
VDLHLLKPKAGSQMIRVTSSWKKIVVQVAWDHSDVKNLSKQLLYWMCSDKPTLTIYGNQHPLSHHLVHNNLGRVQRNSGCIFPGATSCCSLGARRLELEFHTSSLERVHHMVIWTVKIGQILGCAAECLPVYMIQVCSKQRFPSTSLQVLLFIETWKFPFANYTT